jgi:hypothetical protein
LVNTASSHEAAIINQKSIVMKKATNILAAIMLLFSVSSFAAGKEEVSQTVRAAFEKDFLSKKEVSWEMKEDFYFVSFKLNEIPTNAAYNEKGELLAVSRDVDVSQIPLSISMALANRYNGFKLPLKATEVNFEGQTSYYLTVENDKKLLTLKCSSNGNISVEKKIKK